jgi:hypothetical protein
MQKTVTNTQTDTSQSNDKTCSLHGLSQKNNRTYEAAEMHSM